MTLWLREIGYLTILMKRNMNDFGKESFKWESNISTNSNINPRGISILSSNCPLQVISKYVNESDDGMKQFKSANSIVLTIVAIDRQVSNGRVPGLFFFFLIFLKGPLETCYGETDFGQHEIARDAPRTAQRSSTER